jgi:hypothetical protein
MPQVITDAVNSIWSTAAAIGQYIGLCSEVTEAAPVVKTDTKSLRTSVHRCFNGPYSMIISKGHLLWYDTTSVVDHHRLSIGSYRPTVLIVYIVCDWLSNANVQPPHTNVRYDNKFTARSFVET